MARCRIRRAVDAIAIALSRLLVRNVGMPHVSVDFGEFNAGFTAAFAEQAEFDAISDLGEDRVIYAAAVVRGAQGVGPTGPNIHSLFRLGTVASDYALDVPL